ncbi:MAG TPA: PEGA domain-containing protein, partial [Terriglobales bacterium]|nr:PEGA domain-containing protein [Terriglobales bacterium]
FAADTVLTWPATGDPVLRFTVGKLRQVSSASGQTDYLGDALAENLGAKPIPSASFYLYLLDKNGKRVGEGYLEVTNLAAGQQAKVPVSVHAIGSFARMELQPQHLPTDEPMKIKMSITSEPSGASVKLDSQASGVTPQILAIAPGKHTVEFSKEGYETASTSVEIAENAPPGTLNLELAPLSLDTVVLRDGTMLAGNVTSVTATSVSINVKGKVNRLQRTRVARVVFGQRGAASSAAKSATASRKKK